LDAVLLHKQLRKYGKRWFRVSMLLNYQKKTFVDKYLDLLQKFEVEYNENYLFEWIE